MGIINKNSLAVWVAASMRGDLAQEVVDRAALVRTEPTKLERWGVDLAAAEIPVGILKDEGRAAKFRAVADMMNWCNVDPPCPDDATMERLMKAVLKMPE
jgi:hypothetical protein